jgi:hypothetical protein
MQILSQMKVRTKLHFNLRLIAFIAVGIVVCSTAIILILPNKLFLAKHEITGFTQEMQPQTIKAIQQYTLRHPGIASVGIISLDFQHNIRKPLLRITPSIVVDDRLKQMAFETSTVPIFTQDKLQNNEMTALLISSFSCENSDQGKFAQIYKLQDILKLSCRIPLTPSVGRLVGYLSIHFTKAPTITELKNIEKDGKLLAVTIYYNEMLPL